MPQIECLPHTFVSGTERCAGFLHKPAGVARPPVVLMGNGLATEWNFGTQDFIEAFTAAGLATFNFDYRYFGASTGEPRQLLNFRQQLDDWQAAYRFLQTLDAVDGRRLALWGSSLGGGHALMLAAQTPGLCAVVVQVPHLDSRAAMKATPRGQILRTLGHAVYDRLRAVCGLSPHCLPVVAAPGELGLLNQPGWQAHYLSLVPATSQWRNAVPARSLFSIGNYSPVEVLEQIEAPLLLVYGRQDARIPAASVEAAAKHLAKATLWPYEGDHFEVYHGPRHAALVAHQCEFLQRHLLA